MQVLTCFIYATFWTEKTGETMNIITYNNSLEFFILSILKFLKIDRCTLISLMRTYKADKVTNQDEKNQISKRRLVQFKP